MVTPATGLPLVSTTVPESLFVSTGELGAAVLRLAIEALPPGAALPPPPHAVNTPSKKSTDKDRNCLMALPSPTKVA
jgi:hypothetical protein